MKGPPVGEKTGSARVLVTDLDGTLLGGDGHDRRRLRDVLNRHPDITVVFATGRSLASVQALLRDDPLVPSPRWIIADVGASVIEAIRMVHLEDIQGKLRAGWPGAHRVRAALQQFPQLVYQEGVPQEGRCSFYLNPEGLSDDLKATVKALGCSWSYASGRYFDVLPARASKGRALRLLGRRLGWPRQAMLVAGDSLNDLSLFSQGTHAVVVANAEPALAAGVPPSKQVHHSALDGAAAVLEGMERLGWLVRRSVVVGYHRPPVRWLDGGWRPPSSPNGILPTLQAALTDERLDAVWAAAYIGEAPPAAEPMTAVDGLPLSLLPLRAERWAGYFHRVCKETLWPALMSQPGLIQDRPAHWADYEEVNAAFARHIGSLAAQGGTVWLHDYNLWLVPAVLRAQRPDLAIGLFHHTPFPQPDVFSRIPAAGQLLDSLACLDWAGFHTADCADNFRRLLAGTAGPTPRVGVHPLGIDRHAVADLARTRPQPRQGKDCSQLVLSVERLDYAKAPVHKIRALDALLAGSPGLRGRVRYRLVCPPPEVGIRAYDSTRSELENAISRINDRWGTHGWEPVDYIPRNLDFPEVVDHYLAADVFWVTSLADGMNLTAQEYITACHAINRPGVLILSRHAGVAQHLGTAALLTDPLRPQDLVDTLRAALAMTVHERAAHITRLEGRLNTPPPAEWAHTVIAAIRGLPSRGRNWGWRG
ncbi:trehalose-6-phosphate synthase [Streptomyces lunaelactis]|nr:trehalose-6-phosphate synthase [Streptomyces lunaelactis]NUK23202.1 trehalose-6-phosphate synthase [Streptomyces lunaelactis]NUK34580.1 trehalose-6-phosphate synthase [Streptomyces lunaelactis]NUK42027.1 trehalose-6-phosphate synthase [Streptomyces lunaelactis]NUK58203.1 trehalose-6-phosphate synthase [Streptomyces lunaelactis]